MGGIVDCHRVLDILLCFQDLARYARVQCSPLSLLLWFIEACQYLVLSTFCTIYTVLYSGFNETRGCQCAGLT